MKRATIQAVRPDASRPVIGSPGVMLGNKYRLEAAIARGGMARVWRATHVTLNRPVAVKFVEMGGASLEERNARFLREAKVAASVRHRHVVDILDFGTAALESGTEPYMVMELLEGETLDQRISRGVIPDREIVEVVAQILSGLDAVHRVGIVHRDLKPGNVFLSHDDVDGVFARLLDFGISTGEGDAHDDKVVVGTPEYMSPEQAFGEPLDARSDLYAVGTVLYEMLSGVLPFEDVDPQKVVEMVAHETPPPLVEMRPDVPELCAIAARAMAPLPKNRFASAREMRRALLDAAESTFGAGTRDGRVSGTQARASDSATLPQTLVDRSSAPPSGARSRAAKWALVAGAVGLLATGATIAWALGGGRERTRDGDAAWVPAPLPEEPAATLPVEPLPTVSSQVPVPVPAAEPLPREADPATEAAVVYEASEVRAPRARPRRTARRAASEAAPAIRRELDF